jgi:hypothetical protein
LLEERMEGKMAIELREATQDLPSPSNVAVGQENLCGSSSDPETPSYLRIIIDLPPEAAREFKEFVHQTGDTLPDLLRKALGLYKLSKEAVQEGKFVGIAEMEDALDTEFVGF